MREFLTWLSVFFISFVFGWWLGEPPKAEAQYNLSTVNIQQPQNTLNTEATAAADTAGTTSVVATRRGGRHDR